MADWLHGVVWRIGYYIIAGSRKIIVLGESDYSPSALSYFSDASGIKTIFYYRTTKKSAIDRFLNLVEPAVMLSYFNLPTGLERLAQTV